jgi:hypothetical protein
MPNYVGCKLYRRAFRVRIQASSGISANVKIPLPIIGVRTTALFSQLNGANRYAILYRVHDAKTGKTRM